MMNNKNIVSTKETETHTTCRSQKNNLWCSSDTIRRFLKREDYCSLAWNSPWRLIWLAGKPEGSATPVPSDRASSLRHCVQVCLNVYSGGSNSHPHACKPSILTEEARQESELEKTDWKAGGQSVTWGLAFLQHILGVFELVGFLVYTLYPVINLL